VSGEQLGDEPVEAQYKEKMIAVVQALDAVFNGTIKGAAKQTGFILLVFPYGESEGRCNHMSNGADRRDVIVMLKEQIARFEGQAELKGRA